jgi:hypothetical protein
MNQLKLRLMFEEALKRLRDAKTLDDAMELCEQSDSPYLLRLLALELLLKLIHEAVLCKPANRHEYAQLFKNLPFDLQERLLSLAGERVGPSALASEHKRVLEEWGKNFIALRYPWERYANMTEDDFKLHAEAWVESGSPLEGATFRYFPEELAGLLAALRTVATELVKKDNENYEFTLDTTVK